MAAMTCAHCELQVPGEARVCPKCGYVFASHERAAARDVKRQVFIVVAVAAILGAMAALILTY